MATTAILTQSKAEIISHPIDYTDALLEGVTVVSAVATHTPPSGDASTPVVTVDSPIVYAKLGPLSVTGDHTLSVLATLSNGDKSEVQLTIQVPF